jgi:hypothetical protein
MAKAAAPYCHARLQVQAVGHNVTVNPISEILQKIDGTTRGLPTEQESTEPQPDYLPKSSNGTTH